MRFGAELANRLHVRTRPGFIRGEMLFAEGDCFDPYLISESQRLLERFGFIASARVLAEDDSVGGKRVRIETRDEWTTRLDVGVTYDDGLNLENFNFVEDNFLGRGLVAEASRRRRLEQESSTFRLSAPSVFRRTNVGVRAGRTPDGAFGGQWLVHPFTGDVGRLSTSETWSSSTSLFAYATDGGAAWSHVLAPVREDHLMLSAGTRRGDPRASLIVGTSFTRDVFRPEPVELARNGDFQERAPAPASLPAAVARQGRAIAATRATLHLGLRHYRYVTYTGLDAVRDAETVGIGFLAGASLGRSLPVLAPAGTTAVRDVYARVHASMGWGLGPVLLHGGTTLEGRREAGDWRDLLAEGDLVAYLRGVWLPGQTIFLRASAAGGWRTDLPYQLTLGGREGVRALGNDAFPGGRQLLFVAEDRVRFGWVPANAVDLGATLFTDWGRVWAGDVPYGTNSGWRGAAGFGLRVAFPSGSRNVWRPDLVFPVGPGASGGPIFRMTWELNRIRSGFLTPDLSRSRRFNLGPEQF